MRLRLKGMGLAVLMTGVVCVSGSITACNKYQPVEVSAQAEDAGNGQNGGGENGKDAAKAGENGAAGNGGAAGSNGKAAGSGEQAAQAQTSKNEADVTKAKPPEFEAVDETVYVKTADGGTVNVRSSCNKQNNSNVVSSVSHGAQLQRTGKSEEWSRVVVDGQTAYIATSFLSTEVPETKAPASNSASVAEGEVKLDPSWKYADFSKINSGAAVLYRSDAASRKNKTICVNAGHGTKGGGSVKTQCHPDGTPKVTGGTTSAGATTAVAVSSGMTFNDGTPEAKVTVAMANILKEKLLAQGYDVLMIREGDDVQLDNIARTVIANNASDCHIALHWDSTENNKGAFYMSVPSNSSYRAMEPVKSHWQQHNALGEALISGLKGAGVKIFSNGAMEMDLTQTSYSTVPSIDIELGDKASDHSNATLSNLADGLVAGINQYFGN